MKSGSKSALAKTMRVATTFTGAAACAAAFAPAATAATHATHPTHPTANLPYRPFPTAGQHVLRGAAVPDTTGSIRTASCTAARHNWLHVDWFSPFGSGPFQTCVGFKGTLTGLSIEMFAQCGGNNHGKFFPGGLTYGPGTTYRTFTPSRFVSKISIAGWAGTDAC